MDHGLVQALTAGVVFISSGLTHFFCLLRIVAGGEVGTVRGARAAGDQKE
jgi:hypothetical protein